MAIILESGIPMPNVKLQTSLFLEAMQVGDSFHLPWPATMRDSFRSSITNARVDFEKRNPGTKFKTRTQDGGLRTWRVA
jgi:hypothetical protein